ncbi:unnamed protein product, partial [Rotaria sp. Silwood2]
MILNSETNTDEISDEYIFEGESFRCRLSFYGRGQNASAPTLVNNRTNLHKGDLFVINLNDEGTQKLVMEVDEERSATAAHPVEMQVKEQYLSRGDMWRFSRKLINTNVYLKKSFDIYGMRAMVYGLWVDAAPYRVSSGYITKDTK